MFILFMLFYLLYIVDYVFILYYICFTYITFVLYTCIRGQMVTTTLKFSTLFLVIRIDQPEKVILTDAVID